MSIPIRIYETQTAVENLITQITQAKCNFIGYCGNICLLGGPSTFAAWVQSLAAWGATVTKMSKVETTTASWKGKRPYSSPTFPSVE